MSKRISTSNVCPTALGTGLLALDVVCRLDSNDIPPCYAGGTCGNVLTILSYLGWNTLPISRLAPGKAAEYVLNDLQRWDVGTSFVSVKEGRGVPRLSSIASATGLPASPSTLFLGAALPVAPTFLATNQS